MCVCVYQHKYNVLIILVELDNDNILFKVTRKWMDWWKTRNNGTIVFKWVSVGHKETKAQEGGRQSWQNLNKICYISSVISSTGNVMTAAMPRVQGFIWNMAKSTALLPNDRWTAATNITEDGEAELLTLKLKRKHFVFAATSVKNSRLQLNNAAPFT